MSELHSKSLGMGSLGALVDLVIAHSLKFFRAHCLFLVVLRGTIPLSASSSCAVTGSVNLLAEDGPGQGRGKGDVLFFRLKERRGFFDDEGRFSLSPSMALGCTNQRFSNVHAHKHVVISQNNERMVLSCIIRFIRTRGLVTQNRALGLWHRALFLVTRPQARTDKSNRTLRTML